jgi:hypothetical protein
MSGFGFGNWEFLLFRMGRFCHWCLFVLLVSILGMSGCSQRLDPALQTPITRQTLDAFQPPPTIQNQQQAAIAALRELTTSRLEYLQPPMVISAYKTTLKHAMKIMATKREKYMYIPPENYPVWLVIFEGEFRIVPPGPDSTPGPYSHRCVWVMIGAEKDQGGAVKSAACKN